MSFCTTPRNPVNSAVVAPMTSTTVRATSEYSNSGDMRATMNTPAVTIVAAWINAEMVGVPSMEAGSQTWSGIWADLPMAPMNSNTQATVTTDQGCPVKISSV